MARTMFKGALVKTIGDLPRKGHHASTFKLAGKDLSDVSLGDFKGKKVLLNIFPSIDTPVCATSVRRFNKEAASLKDCVVICVSMDLPFAQGRFCGAEGIEGVVMASAFRSPSFGRRYGVPVKAGPLKGLFARAVVAIDPKGKILYSELVPEITQEPDYDAALAALKE